MQQNLHTNPKLKSRSPSPTSQKTNLIRPYSTNSLPTTLINRDTNRTMSTLQRITPKSRTPTPQSHRSTLPNYAHNNYNSRVKSDKNRHHRSHQITLNITKSNSNHNLYNQGQHQKDNRRRPQIYGNASRNTSHPNRGTRRLKNQVPSRSRKSTSIAIPRIDTIVYTCKPRPRLTRIITTVETDRNIRIRIVIISGNDPTYTNLSPRIIILRPNRGANFTQKYGLNIRTTDKSAIIFIGDSTFIRPSYLTLLRNRLSSPTITLTKTAILLTSRPKIIGS